MNINGIRRTAAVRFFCASVVDMHKRKHTKSRSFEKEANLFLTALTFLIFALYNPTVRNFMDDIFV